jgi:hypothetical protein
MPVSLKDIKISSPSKLKIRTLKHTEKNNNSLSITTQSSPCSFYLYASKPLDVKISATVDKMTSLSISTLYPTYKIKPHIVATYNSFDTNQNPNSSFDIKSTYYICR